MSDASTQQDWTNADNKGPLGYGIGNVCVNFNVVGNPTKTGVDAMITPSLVLLRLRTVGDAELEVWGARRKRALFEQVFDREVEFSTHPSLR